MADVLGWDQVVQSDAYKSLSPDAQNSARLDYFRQVVAPQVPQADQGSAWSQFDSFSRQFLKAPPADPAAQSSQQDDTPDLSSSVGEAQGGIQYDPANLPQHAADVGHAVMAGAAATAQQAVELGHQVEKFQNPALAQADEAGQRALLGGDTITDRLGQAADYWRKGESADMQAAQQKKWWDSDKGTFGDAWSDPNAYLSGIGESVVPNIVAMAPGIALAPGAYATKLARLVDSPEFADAVAKLVGQGATHEAATATVTQAAKSAAAETAAKTAGLAGQITEGLQGGAQSAQSVRDDINQMSPDELRNSDAYNALLQQGLSPEQAKHALAEDASTRGFVLGGVATGVFGGTGDKVLARMMTKGASGGIAKRFLLGGLSEGVMEEVPQNFFQQIGENAAKRQAKPDQDLMEGAVDQALGGAAVGFFQGGGMGAVMGHSHAEPVTASNVKLTGDFHADIQAIIDAPITQVDATGQSSTQSASTTAQAASSAPVVAGVDATGQDAAAVAPPSQDANAQPAASDVGGSIYTPAEGDIVRPSDNQPFGAKAAAQAHAESEGINNVAPVQVGEGQWVLRPVKAATSEEIDAAAQQADTSATDAQKAAGNYQKGHLDFQGLNVSVENPKGSERSGVDSDGTPWSVTMEHHYGYIRQTEGADGDHVDAFIGPNPASQKVYVVDQVGKDGNFDEHKVMLGFDSKEEADKAYHANYAPGWTGRGAITEMPMGMFRRGWVANPENTAHPLADGIPSATDTEQAHAAGVKSDAASGSTTAEATDVSQARESAPDPRDITAVNVLNGGLARNGEAVRIAGSGKGARSHGVRNAAAGGVGQGHIGQRLARVVSTVFGKRAVFVESAHGGPAPFNGVTIARNLPGHVFLDAHATVHPVAIATHELGHHIEREFPEGYKELRAVVRGNADVKSYIAQYRKANTDPISAGKSDHQIEGEMVNDLMGNRLLERDTWQALAERNLPVFKRVAKLVVAKFDEWIGNAKKLGGADQHVTGDLEAIRSKVVDVLAQYADRGSQTQGRDQGAGAEGAAAPGERLAGEGRRVSNGDGTVQFSRGAEAADGHGEVAASYAQRAGVDTPVVAHRPGAPGAVSVVGIHYGKESGLRELSGSRFGTGMKAEERNRVASGHPDIRQRINFYVQRADHSLPAPESGVGPHVYRSVLSNLLDSTSTQAQAIWADIRARGITDDKARLNAFEKAAVDAGYDGYLNRANHNAVVIAPSVRAEFMGYRAHALDKIAREQAHGNEHTESASGARSEGVRVAGGVRGGAGSLAGNGRADQGPRRALEGAPAQVKVPGRGKVAFGIFEKARNVAEKYMRDAGLPVRTQERYVKVDATRAKRIAQAYAEMRHEPNDPVVKAAYEAMIRETKAQYDAMLDAGLKVEFIDYEKTGDPYAASPRLAILDVIENNHLWVFSTRDGFGSSSFDPSSSPMLADSGYRISGKPALFNDLFRAVHDYFGHIENGVGFRADGEENAWRAHSVMYTPLARRAMTTETRGQNSWVNFGPHGENNRTASSTETVYADQKTGLLPAWISEEGAFDEPTYSRKEEGDGRGEEDHVGGSARGRSSEQDVQRTVGGGAPAQGWAGATRISGKSGEPVRVHRGSARALTRADFHEEALGHSTGNPSSGLGVWFTSSRAEASGYGPVREAAYLDIRNPKVIKFDELPGFDSVRDAAKFRERLQAQGYDGIVLTGKHLGKAEVHFVAFHADQVVMHDEPVFSRKREGDTISTRNPTGKRSSEDAITHQLSIGLEALQRDPEGFAHNVGLVTSYPGYRNEGARTPAQKAERFIKHVTANLLWLHDSMTPELRARSKLWYEGANKIAKQFSRDYKVSTRQSAGMLAALSPQKDWFQNVSLAKRVAETMAQHQNTPWTPEMTATAERLASGQSRTLKAQPQVEKLNNHLTKLFDAIKGKTLGELSDSLIEQAAWVRVFDETHNARSYPVVTPEGSFEGLSLNGDGSATKVAWGDYRTIANAISIYRNGSIENISNTLGTEHKVRSFYNNIIDPQSEEGHVTIDTHAVAAALLRPLAGSSREVLHNFGNNVTGEPGPANSKVHGTSGLYGMYADAYRRAAEERGILPREMQSITWEAVRGLFSPEFKRAEQKRAEANGSLRKADRVATADQIWKDYTDGKLTLEQARTQVHDLAGGISVPEWAGGRPAGEVDEAEGRAGDAGELPADRVPGRATEAVDGGAGVAAPEGAAAAVPDEVTYSRKDWEGQQERPENPVDVVGDFDPSEGRKFATVHFDLQQDGRSVGEIMGSFDGHTLYIGSIDSKGGPQSLGAGRMRDVLRQLAQKLPGLHEVVGQRVSGVRERAGNTDDLTHVTFARKSLRDYQQNLKDGLDAVFHSKKTTSVWDRTVGTMSNLARKSPEFRKVYDKANDFIHDISYFASTAAEQAPTLLPRLDGIRSLGKGLGKTITGERTADLKAAANLAYQGTLDKQVHTPEELARRGVKASVIKMYQEARAAVDLSLEQTGTSIMARMARTLGLDVGNVREMGMQEARSKIVDALRAQRDALRPLLENERQLLSLKAEEFSKQLTPEALHQTLKSATEKVDALQRKYDEAVKSIDDVNDVAGRVVDLQNEGYFPLMRFGKYTLYATQKVNGKTEQLYFGMFESEKKRIEMERALRATYPNAEVVPGVANDNVDRLFKGVNLDSLEVFAKALGADEEDVFQQYLKLAVANRSAIKRMIERKEVPGFSTDMTRTLASFLTSNARMASRNYHWADAKAAALAIPKEKGDLQKAAVSLLEYIEHPNEEGQLPRALNFTWYILGNISSAAVNLTQPAMTTFPTLSKWGAKEATAAMGKAAALLSNRTKMDPDLRAALKRAEEQGVVEPHEIHYLYGEQQRHFLSGDTRAGAIAARAQRALGEAFALAESVNRHLTFVAGYLRARDLTPEQLAKEGVTDPFDYAMKLVDRTQFVYNKANRPQWARGTIQSLLFQFKTYSISSIELFHQLTREGPEGKKAAGIMLAVWMLAAGYAGLPFEKNIEDMVDTVGQLLGYDTNARAFMRDHMQQAALKLLGEHLGPLAEDVMTHGLSHLGPLDLSNRLGFGDLIPATAMGKRSETGNRTKDALELLGPTGATVQALLNKMDAFENDKDTPNGTVPGFIGNVMQAVDMARTGLYRDDKGKTVAAITPTDVAVKALGFTPTDVQREQERMSTINQSVMLSKTVQEAYTQRIAMALADAQLLGTPKADAEASKTVDGILNEVERWNERNPDTPVALQTSAIEGAVKQMILTREVRELKTAPRAMKGIIASQLLSEEH